MKILRVITRLNIGGPAIQAMDLHRLLSARDHECQLTAGISPKEEGCMFTQYPHYIPVRFQCSLERELNFKMDYYAYKALCYKIKTFKPDILHTHMSKAGALARLAALTIPKSKRPKLIHIYHGHTFHSYFSKRKEWIFRNIERFLARFTDKIIVISNQQYNDIVYKYKIAPKDKVEIIKLGFDLDELLKIEESEIRNYGTLYIAIIGRIAEIKNHLLFLDFIEEMSKIKEGVVGFVIGDGDKELKKKLQIEVCKRELDVQFMGWQKLSDWLEVLDMVVCTSKNEGTPVSLIEAMAAGRLVVSTRVGGVPDLLGDHLNRGIMIDDLEVTAKTVKRVLDDGSYKDIIKRAREYVKEEHTLNRLVDQIEDLYKELVYG